MNALFYGLVALWGLAAILAGPGRALAQAADGAIDTAAAQNKAGRTYVRLLVSGSQGGTINVPLDSSIVVDFANFRLRDIVRLYGVTRTNGAADMGLAFTSANLNGTQILGRYRQTGTGVATLEVTVPCASTGRQDSLGAALRAQGLPYGAAPAGASDVVVENVEATWQNPYSVTFQAANFDAAERVYGNFLRANSTSGAWRYGGSQSFTSAQMFSQMQLCSVRTSNDNPIVGSPQSLQHQTVEQALDLSEPLIGGGLFPQTGVQSGVEDIPWGLGGRIGIVDRSGTVGTQFDLRLSRMFRLHESSRALLIVDLPVSYFHASGNRLLRVSTSVAVRLPLARNWAVEPRIGYGYVAGEQGRLSGQVASASVTSLLHLQDPMGRGAFTLGNMLGYTKVTALKMFGTSIDARTENLVLRNALAYELPIVRRTGARQMSVRGSYTLTSFQGDQLHAKTYHDVTVSMGVRARNLDVRNGFEMLRIGVNGVKARDYRAAHIVLGARF